MDPSTEPVQPEEGQGGAGNEGDPPYADFLNRVPEEVRGDVEPVFRDWDANVTRLRQQDAEYRRNWEPYEQLRDNLGSPEDVQALLQFRDLAANDPQAVAQWYQEYAQQNGLTPQQQESPGGTSDPVDFFAGEKEQIDRLLEERLAPLQQDVEQFRQWQAERQEQERIQGISNLIETQFSELEQKHGKDILDREIVEKFVPDHWDTDPQQAVFRAYEDAQKLVAQIQRSALQQKAGDPLPAEAGGVANAAPDQPQSFADAKPQAQEMVRQIMQRAVS